MYPNKESLTDPNWCKLIVMQLLLKECQHKNGASRSMSHRFSLWHFRSLISIPLNSSEYANHRTTEWTRTGFANINHHHHSWHFHWSWCWHWPKSSVSPLRMSSSTLAMRACLTKRRISSWVSSSSNIKHIIKDMFQDTCFGIAPETAYISVVRTRARHGG